MDMERKRDDIQRFDRWSGTYERSFLQALLFDRVHQAVLDSIPGEIRPESILDIGCGTGRLLRKAGARWPVARLIGVDPAEGMIENARNLTPGATFYTSMAESLPLPDTSVDLVLSTTSFHHWRDQAQGVRQVARVLRPGGHFFLADTSLPRGLSTIIRHFRLHDADTVREMFAQAGLNVQGQRRLMGRFLLVTIGERH
jgi:ubiquinone/menaquinone biosynthesis C-methylase UbiE